MRVVFDTSVLIAAFATRGVCSALLARCADPRMATIILSESILDEFRKKAAKKIGMPDAEVRDALALLRSRAVIVIPVDVPPDSTRDHADLHVLGAVLAGSANILVTGDKDLLVLKQFRGVAILSPRDLVTLLAQSAEP